MSIGKHTLIENKSVGLESLLHASRRANPQQTFHRSSTEFAEIVAAVVIAKNREIVRGKLRSVRGRVVRSREQGITWTPPGTRAPYFFIFAVRLDLIWSLFRSPAPQEIARNGVFPHSRYWLTPVRRVGRLMFQGHRSDGGIRAQPDRGAGESGPAKCPRAKSKRLGRPRKILDTKRTATLRAQGVGWKRIAAGMGVGVGTIYRVALEGSKIREKVI